MERMWTGSISIHLDRVPFDQAFQTILTLKTLVALPMGPRVITRRHVHDFKYGTISSRDVPRGCLGSIMLTRQMLKKPLDSIRFSCWPKGAYRLWTRRQIAVIITDTIEGLKEAEDLIPVLDRKTSAS